MGRTITGWLLAAAALAALAGPWPAAAQGGRVPKPVITIEQPGQCVADTDTMRRNHMEMLKHDRDRTMRDGVRKVQASLKGCVECHASRKTGSVNAAPDDFCAGCHRYAAVKIDCFECHSASRAARAPAASGPAAAARFLETKR